jgi:hypothetical protein
VAGAAAEKKKKGMRMRLTKTAVPWFVPGLVILLLVVAALTAGPVEAG